MKGLKLGIIKEKSSIYNNISFSFFSFVFFIWTKFTVSWTFFCLLCLVCLARATRYFFFLIIFRIITGKQTQCSKLTIKWFWWQHSQLKPSGFSWECSLFSPCRDVILLRKMETIYFLRIGKISMNFITKMFYKVLRTV